MRNLQQHSQIGSSDPGQAQHAYGGSDNQDIQVLERNGNFAQLPVLAAGYEKNVKTLTQYSPFKSNMISDYRAGSKDRSRCLTILERVVVPILVKITRPIIFRRLESTQPSPAAIRTGCST